MKIGNLVQPRLSRKFILLLLVTVSASMAISLAFIYLERDRIDLGVLAERSNQRISALITAIEGVNSESREAIINSVTTRQFRIALSNTPVVSQPPLSKRADRLVEQLQIILPDHTVLADHASPDGKERRHNRMRIFSIKLNSDGSWVNVVSRLNKSQAADDDTLIGLMTASLIGVLAVGLYFIAQLVRPLSDIAKATRLAGSGDRTIRLSEEGPIELKDIAIAFNEMQDRISKFDEERNRTLAAVGHDLRTPITSLRIRAEMMDEEEGADFIRILDEMILMAESLITYSKGTSDQEPAETIDLSAFMNELCEERDIKFIGKSLFISGKPFALRRAFGNLLDNAVRYAKDISVTVQSQKKFVEIQIEDNGPGIPEEKLVTIFDPFVRVDDSRDKETGGHGLGLAIAKSIITLHGGTIEVANRSPKGLKVTVNLPV